MQSALASVRKNIAYAFAVIGAIWVVIAFLVGSGLVLWPAVACVAAAVLLKVWPGSLLSIAWGPAAAVLGLLLCAYQVYEAVLLLFGAFAMIAGASVVLFFLLGIGHAFLAYASYSGVSVK